LWKSFELPKGIKLLQYVDDLLVARETEEETRKGTIKLLNFLGENGLKISKSKLQFVESEVQCLGHWISKQKKKLDPERVPGILNMGPPKSKREIKQFL
ncbi:POL5 protein, partial [Pelecanoides urinatrix]|nr:POL5 protein [Pelecanoides urinatrix]